MVSEITNLHNCGDSDPRWERLTDDMIDEAISLLKRYKGINAKIFKPRSGPKDEIAINLVVPINPKLDKIRHHKTGNTAKG